MWKLWIGEISRRRLFVRYDERGCGLSEWNVQDLSFDAWVRDQETVVEGQNLRRVLNEEPGEMLELLTLTPRIAAAVQKYQHAGQCEFNWNHRSAVQCVVDQLPLPVQEQTELLEE